MQTATVSATSLKVATTLPCYLGPLGHFLEHQQQAAAAAQAARLLDSMRANVLAMLDEPHLFSGAERAATATAVDGCQCMAQLQRWFRNVYRLMKERELELFYASEEGFYTHIPVAA